MGESWFAERLQRTVATLGKPAADTFRMLRSLPVDAVRNNVAQGMSFAAGRGREPWRHQAEAMEAVRLHLEDRSKDPTAIVVMPTGSGKTEIFLRVAEASGLEVGETRLAVPTLVLEPTRQLVTQTVEAFRERFPKLHALPMETGQGLPGTVTVLSYDLFMDMVLDGRIKPDDVAAIVMDEAHRGLSDMRRDVIGRFLGNTVITAYSATPAFDAIKNVHALLGRGNEVCRISDERLRQEGVISPVINYVLRTNIQGRLPTDAKLRRAVIRDATAKTLLNFVSTHEEAASGVALRDKIYLGYTNGIDRAREVAGMLAGIGLAADSVSGDDGTKVVDAKLKELAGGRIRALVNDKVLVEGTDVPQVRGVLAVDPTVSLVKHLQRCGRARRIDPDLDRFDPRQTSSVVEVLVEVNGVPLRDQRIYAEAIGDLTVVKLVNTPPQDMDGLIRDAVAKGLGEADPDDEIDALLKGGEPDEPRPRPERVPRAAAEDGFEVSDGVLDIHYLLRLRDKGGVPPGYFGPAMLAAALGMDSDDERLLGMLREIEDDLVRGVPTAVGGSPVAAALMPGSVGDGPKVCLHGDALSALRSALGMEFATDDHASHWLNRNQVANNLGVRVRGRAFEATWEAATAGRLAIPTMPGGGAAMRPLARGGSWAAYVHPAALPAFEERLGRKARFAFPAKSARHLEFAEVCSRIGAPDTHNRMKGAWRAVGEEYARDGSLRDGERRVDYDLVLSPDGGVVACLGVQELAWFSARVGFDRVAGGVSDWVSYANALQRANVPADREEAFRDLWAEISKHEEDGMPAVVSGRTWKAARLVSGRGKVGLYVHADEIPALEAMFGRPRADEWLPFEEVRARLALPEAHLDRLWLCWTELRRTHLASGAASFEGREFGFRLEESRQAKRFLLRAGDVDALGEAVRSVPPEPKTEDWMDRGEVAAALGVPADDPRIQGTWDWLAEESAGPGGAIQDRVSGGLVSAHLHRRRLERFASLAGLRVPGIRTEEHLAMVDLLRVGGLSRYAREVSQVAARLAWQVSEGREPTLPDGRPVRYEYVGMDGPGYCFHRDDIGAISEAVERMRRGTVAESHEDVVAPGMRP